MNEIGVLVKVMLNDEKHSLEYAIKELTNLAKVCNITIKEQIIQSSDRFNNKTYLGSGKLQELKTLIENNDISIAVFDDELSATQLRNIEEVLEIKVIDRSMLILDIFRKNAKTNESILEVKLAQLRYLYPRLAGMHTDLSRQGGFQTKGPGEKQIDLDRRKIAEEIYFIEQKLNVSRQTRYQRKQKRLESKIPIVALVGYTNSGKSTTMNTLINQTSKKADKLVLQKDQLFATLDTSVRKIKLKNGFEFMLVDTVGFISKLPHHLVNSFHSTLSDTLDADLILHVVDSSNMHFNKHITVTNEVLDKIGASHIKQVYVLNKYDERCATPFIHKNEYIEYSNKTLYNFDVLTNFITNNFKKELYTDLNLHIPQDQGKLISYIESKAIIEKRTYNYEFIHYTCSILNDDVDLFEDYIVTYTNEFVS